MTEMPGSTKEHDEVVVTGTGGEVGMVKWLSITKWLTETMTLPLRLLTNPASPSVSESLSHL